MKTILTFCALALSLILPSVSSAQTNYNYVASSGSVSLSSQTYAVTIQQPATNALPVSFPSSTVGAQAPPGAWVYCSSACVLTISRDCTTPATATLNNSSVVGTNPTTPTNVFNFYTASNASGCTSMNTVNIAAGAPGQGIDLSTMKLGTGNTSTSLTLSIASVTATVIISIFPLEQH